VKEMPKVRVNDITLYYETLGDGTPLVMIMGYMVSAENRYRFPTFIDALGKQHQVILFDNRGTGRSEAPDHRYSIRVMADDTNGLMDALTIPKANVIGLSMGGMIAQELALNYPDTVLSLTLCSTCCNVKHVLAETDPDFRKFIESAAAGQPPVLPPEEFLRLFFKWVHTSQYVETHRAALIKAQMAMQYPTPPHTLTRQGQAVLQHNVCHRLQEITVPVLVLHGEADILVPPLHAQTLAEQIPNADLHIFPNAAHDFFTEIEEQTVNTILNFLSHVDKSL
jgi:pimeloyl-ACP methyl ester carboxylesterase